MFTWLVSRLIRRRFDKLSAGDARPVVRSFGDGARFTFPGEHSWALDTTDRTHIAAWFERFAAQRPQFVIEDVVAHGPPWNLRVYTRGRDRIDLADGIAYENRWVQYARVSWAKMREDRVYLDTQRVAHLDRLLATDDS
jgi:ketosteroid isomerase-like protein